MRVLWVTPWVPRPTAGGGSSHEYELLRHAAGHHDIHLICSQLPTQSRSLEVDGRTIAAEAAPYRGRGGPGSRLDVAGGVVLRWPTMHDNWQPDRVRALRAALARELRRRPADLVHVSYGDVAPVASASRAPVALLLFDVLSRQLRREKEVTRSRRGRLIWELEARKVERWERRWFTRADGLAAVSPVDGDALRRRLDRPVSTIPNPVPQPFFDTPAVGRSSSDVVFVGHLHYRANVDAVTWLISEIWPRVVDRRPDARLRVVGYDPHPDVVRSARSVGAEVHASPSDVRPFYWGAAVVVAPVRLGSGLRNKVLHAIACRAPLVATATALEGIQAHDQRHLLIADDAGAFADAILRTLDEPRSAEQRAAAALDLLDAYRPERVARQFTAWWERTAARGAAEARA